jgi:hypothetical protein
MGKFKASPIHDLYSEWHYNLIKLDPKYKRLVCSDLDRIWVEVDRQGQTRLTVLDIKFDGGPDSQTPTEAILESWFIAKGAAYYTVYITRGFNRFRVINPQAEERIFNSTSFADWLLMRRNKKMSKLFDF